MLAIYGSGVVRYQVALLVCSLLGVGCGRPVMAAPVGVTDAATGARPSLPATSTPVAEAPVAEAAPESNAAVMKMAPSADINRNGLRVVALAYDPTRAAKSISDAAGLVVARSLACERDQPVQSVTHLCARRAEAALRQLLPGVRAGLELAFQHEDEAGVDCTSTEPVRCSVAPHQECQPLYELHFVGGALVGIVERDDWQGDDETRRALDSQVAALLNDAECP